MYQVLTIIHLLIAVGIIGLIMIQQGKGADAGAAFGSGGGSGSVFGARGAASFLSRTTAIFAVLFFLTSLVLAVMAGSQTADAPVDFMSEGVDSGVQVEQQTPALDSDVPEIGDEMLEDSVESSSDMPAMDEGNEAEADAAKNNQEKSK